MNLSIRKVLFSFFVMMAVPGVSACQFQYSKAKDIDGAEGMAVRKGNGEMVIFYANETPPTPVIADQYARIGNALAAAERSSITSPTGKATLARIAMSYQNDLSRFAVQVQKDANGLESQICRPDINGRKTGLFIFTNKLTRLGKVRFCLPGDYQGKVEEVDFKVDLSAEELQDFRYGEMPLSSQKAFEAMQNTVKSILMAKNIASSDFAYVLISKSHGGGDYVVAPKLSYRSDLLDDNALAARYVEIASTVSIREMRFVDLVLPNGTRIGELILKGTRLEDIDLSSVNASFGDLKVSDLKVGDLGLGDSAEAFLKDLKVGDLKIGDLKVGDLKVGDLKVGDLKSGDLKVGDLKVGELKTGDLKVGDLKVGDLKTGDLKTGDLKNDLASEARPLETPGITKTAMVALLQEFSVALPLVFFESCDSDLGEGLTYDLLNTAQRFNGSTGVESVYFSDRKGLQYETVNYGTLPIGRFFSNSLREALDAKKPG